MGALCVDVRKVGRRAAIAVLTVKVKPPSAVASQEFSEP
jgi:hypothetical protein